MQERFGDRQTGCGVEAVRGEFWVSGRTIHWVWKLGERGLEEMIMKVEFEVLVPLHHGVKYSLKAQDRVPGLEREGWELLAYLRWVMSRARMRFPKTSQLSTAMKQTTPKFCDLFEASHSVWSQILGLWVGLSENSCLLNAASASVAC